MLTFDAVLGAQIKAAQSKLAECNAVIAALGPTRTLRMFHDVNRTAANPFLTGTEFQNVTMTGAMASSAGVINNFGLATAHTIRLPADLTLGSSCLRIEGNGHFVQGTLSLDATVSDFALTGNPTASTGMAFSSAASLGPYGYLASGTGPAAPPVDASMPMYFRIFDYTDPARPVPSAYGSVEIRERDIVPQWAPLAAEIGDIHVRRMADGTGIVLGAGGDCFRFAMRVYGQNGASNKELAGKTVWHARIGAVPNGRHAGYPFRANFNVANDTLAPGPFKAEIYNGAKELLECFEHFDTRDKKFTKGSGRALNLPNQNLNPNSTTEPFRPWWTCHMVLAYKSHATRKSALSSHLLPGVFPEVINNGNVSAYDTNQDVWPIFTGGFSQNGLMDWKVAPKWSRHHGAGFDTAILDKNLNYGQMNRDYSMTQRCGFAYTPAANQTHSWYMAPGGSHHDRADLSHLMCVWATTPDGSRMHGAVPLDYMMEEWNKGYANEGMFLYTNLERGTSLLKKNVTGLEPVCYNDTYYNGGNENFVPDILNHAVRLLTTANKGSPAAMNDKHGRSFANDYARDDQHNYSTAATKAWLKRDAMGIIEGKNSFDSAVLCDFNQVQGHTGPIDFLCRQHNWYNWQLLNMWMIGSSDPNGLTQADVERMWLRHLEQVYDYVHPYFNDNHTNAGWYLNHFGGFPQDGGGNFPKGNVADAGYVHNYNFIQETKIFYFGQTFMIMKQSGAWAAMRAKSTKCAWVLDFMVTCLCRQSVDFFIDGGGRAEGMDVGYAWQPGAHSGNTAPPKTWGDIVRVGSGQDGRLAGDWVHTPAGLLYSAHSLGGDYQEWQGKNPQHLRAQFLWILRDFFPEVKYPRLAQAITLVDGWYAEVEAGWHAGTSAQWHYRYAMFGKFKAPAVVGAP